MSASLKNAVKRKTHKERAQPAKRRRYGLLEKKKDYLLRAKDFHKKEQTLQVLRRKADERNPDEFYFAMENARTRDGVHTTSQTLPNKYSQEELRLMKTQDIGYVRLKAQAEAKKVERLHQSLHFTGTAPAGQRVVFVEEGEEGELPVAPAAEEAVPADPVAAVKAEKRRVVSYRELVQRVLRQKGLRQVVNKMEVEKAGMSKGHKRKEKVKTATGVQHVFRWKQERKK